MFGRRANPAGAVGVGAGVGGGAPGDEILRGDADGVPAVRDVADVRPERADDAGRREHEADDERGDDGEARGKAGHASFGYQTTFPTTQSVAVSPVVSERYVFGVSASRHGLNISVW